MLRSGEISSSQVSDCAVVSSLSAPLLCTCTEGALRRGTAEHVMIGHATVNHLLRTCLTERQLEGLNFRSLGKLLSRPLSHVVCTPNVPN